MQNVVITTEEGLDLRGEIVDLIKNQPQADKWIPCEVELPPQPKENPLYENKPLEIYLVTEKHFGSVSRAFWNGRIFTNRFTKMSVVAWQPLPQPYKKEGAEDERS